MSSSFSVINDLYGVESARRPARQGALGLVIVVLLGSIFLYESIHPVMCLRSEPFFSNTAAAATHHQSPAAKSYWNLAASFVSENYSYGQFLPSRPPEDFTTALGGDYATSSMYWQRVRGIWNQPGNWVQSYQFDTQWIYSAVGSVYKLAMSYINS